MAMSRLGDLDGRRDLAQARVWFERALAINERLAEDEPDNRDYQRDLLCSLHKLSEEARMEDLAHVREHYVKAVEISRRLVAIDESQEIMLYHSHWLIQLGMIESELDRSHAVASFDEAIQIRRSFADKNPDDAEAWCLVASACGNLAEWHLQQGDTARERSLSEQAHACMEHANLLGPDDADMQYGLACTLARLGQTDEAVARLQQAVKLGYADADHVEQDHDLRTLRDLPRFKAIIASMRQAASVP